jgi:hypothetical protein
MEMAIIRSNTREAGINSRKRINLFLAFGFIGGYFTRILVFAGIVER